MRKHINNQSGFTLVEFIIIFLLLGIIASKGCFEESARSRIREKESEVKANLHTIQMALERYATDNSGTYPLILYGGDGTDSFSTTRSPDYEDSQGNMISGVSEFDGDVDPLLEYGYLHEYPTNPFQRRRDIEKYGYLLSQPIRYNLPRLEHRVNIWSNHPNPTHGHPDRSQQLVDRRVGGEFGDVMFDISEGQRHPPFPIVVIPTPDPNSPTNYYHYTNPTLPGNIEKVANYEDDHLFFLMPGNFYYYATFSSHGGYRAFINGNLNFPVKSEVTGYNLAGYGYIDNPGHDVYNIMGDFPDQSLFAVNNPDIPLDELEKFSPDQIYIGPDGRQDGVIIVIQNSWHIHPVDDESDY